MKKTGCVVTCEEHSTVGGLGSAVADILGENYPVPLERVGVRDSFGTSGDPNELLAEFKLDAAGIVERVKAVLAEKIGTKGGVPVAGRAASRGRFVLLRLETWDKTACSLECRTIQSNKRSE